ncbi:MAG: nickel-dependent hydrogenase large subunit, partial [Fusobacterium sp.]
SWIKSPRYDGKPMEVGPLACILISYAKGNEKIVPLVDDFLAMGNAVIGLKKIVEEAGAEVVGVGIVVEKGFQAGGKLLKEAGLNLKSLAIIDSLEDNKIHLR